MHLPLGLAQLARWAPEVARETDEPSKLLAVERRSGALQTADFWDRYSSDWKPIRVWVPSQKGLLADPPHLHRRAVVTRSMVRPVPAQISRGPDTASGPLCCGVIVSAPSRGVSCSLGRVVGSPVATKCASLCEPSQKGLFFDAPHRHSVALVTVP